MLLPPKKTESSDDLSGSIIELTESKGKITSVDNMISRLSISLPKFAYVGAIPVFFSVLLI